MSELNGLITTGVEIPRQGSGLVEWLEQFDSPIHERFTISPIHHFTARPARPTL
jgi:hypothetical protein